MENKRPLIIEMLKNGKSYIAIQQTLKVSPKKIAKISEELFGKKRSTKTDQTNNGKDKPVKPISNDSQSESDKTESSNPKENIQKPAKSTEELKAAYNIKKLELQQERWLKQAEYQENDKIRKFEYEKQQKEIDAKYQSDAKDEQISKQTRRITELSNENRFLEGELNRYMKSCETLNDKLDNVKTELRKSEKDCDKLTDKCDNLTEKLTQTENEFAEYKETHKVYKR